jgi:hypothetical protein
VLVVLDGDPGVGKSTLTCDLAARLSRGELAGRPVTTILVNGEDAAEHTVRPRLGQAGADLDHVVLWKFDKPLFLPKDIDKLREAIREHGAGLLVIDPLTAFLGEEASAAGDQIVRRALMPLIRLAAETGCHGNPGLHSATRSVPEAAVLPEGGSHLRLDVPLSPQVPEQGRPHDRPDDPGSPFGQAELRRGERGRWNLQGNGIKLTNLARASLEGLLIDYRDFLRVRNVPLWDKNSKQAKVVRDRSRSAELSYETFQEFCETRPPEVAANIAL